MPTATMTSKGQITLPKEVREKLHLQPGSKVMFVELPNGRFQLVEKTGELSDLMGILYDPARKPLSIEEMNDAIGDAVAADYLESIAETDG